MRNGLRRATLLSTFTIEPASPGSKSQLSICSPQIMKYTSFKQQEGIGDHFFYATRLFFRFFFSFSFFLIERIEIYHKKNRCENCFRRVNFVLNSKKESHY